MSSIKESSDYTWKVLEENHVVIPTHLKNILSNLGYVGLRVLAKIDDSNMKEMEEFVSKVLGSTEMTKNMSWTQKEEQFGKAFASNPEHFMLLPGDKAVLRVISEVCQQVLESYSNVSSPADKTKKKSKSIYTPIKRIKTTADKIVGEQLNSKNDSDIEMDEEASTDSANRLTLEQHILRWGNRQNLENLPSLFSIKENIVTCLSKRSNSAVCKSEFKVKTDTKGHWKISNFTKHVQQQHISNYRYNCSIPPPKFSATNKKSCDIRLCEETSRTFSEEYKNEFAV